MNTDNLELFTFRLFQDFNHVCTAVSIGKKTVENVITDVDAIVFHVNKKQAADKISDEDMIPEIVFIDETPWPTDVIENSPYSFLIDPIPITGCSGVGLASWTQRHNQQVAAAGVAIGCRRTLPSRTEEVIGTLGLITIDDNDGTFVGVTCNHVIAGNPFFTSEYQPLQDEGEKIWNDNILADNTGCPVIPVFQPNEADENQIGCVKRYHPLKCRPGINQGDVGLIAITGALPLDGWQQLNFILNEDVKNITLVSETTGIKENYTMPWYYGTLDPVEFPTTTFLSDIIIEDKDDYRYYYVHLSGKYSRYFQIEYPEMAYNGSRAGNPKLLLNNRSLLNKDIEASLTATVVGKDYNSVTRLPLEVEYHPLTNIPYTTQEPFVRNFVVTIEEDNRPATLSLENKEFTFPENLPLNSGVFLTKITIDEPNSPGIENTNVLSLFGIDAPRFMIVPKDTVVDGTDIAMTDPSYGRELTLPSDETVAHLYLKPSQNDYLNYEIKHEYSVTVQLDDFSIQKKAGPVIQTVQVSITDVNEYANNLYLSPEILTLNEEYFKLIDGTTRPTTKAIKVANIYWTEPTDPFPDSLNNHQFELFDDTLDIFTIVENSPSRASLYIKPGTIFNFEVNQQATVGVRLTDTSLSGQDPLEKIFTLYISDVKDPPTSMIMTLTSVSENGIPENTVLTEDLLLATFSFVDEDAIENKYIIVGDYSSSFIMKNDGLYMLQGTTLNYEYINQYNLTIYAYDQYIQGAKPLSVQYTLDVIDVNEIGDTTIPPPPVSPDFQITSIITEFNEYGDTSSPVLAAQILTSINLTSNDEFIIDGPDKDDFSITVTGPNTANVYLKTNRLFKYDEQTNHYIIIKLLRDGWPVDAKEYELKINNTNRFPIGIDILNPRFTIKENAYRESFPGVLDLIPLNTPLLIDVPLGFVVVNDDNDGTVTFSVAADPSIAPVNDSAYFKVENGILYIKQGTILDYETKPFYQILIVAEDTTAVNQEVITKQYRLDVEDVNENPILLSFQNVINTIDEDIDVTSQTKLAEIVLSDPDQERLFLDGNELRLFEHDSAFFSLELVDSSTSNFVWNLYLKPSVVLDAIIKPTYQIVICAVDESQYAIGNVPQSTCLPYTLNINPKPKIRFLRTKLGSDPMYKIRDRHYLLDFTLATIEGINELGGVQCGKYSIEPGYPIGIDEEDYTQFFQITQGNCVSEAVLQIKANSELRFFREGRNVFPLSIKCEQENGLDVTMDYVVEIFQPYLPLATTEEIDDLEAERRVWFCGRTSGFQGQNDCPLVLRGVKLAVTFESGGTSDGIVYYYNRENNPLKSNVDFINLLSLGYKYYNLVINDDSDWPARPGDSGSALLADFNGTVKVIGFIMGGSLKHAIACRADLAAKFLDLRTDKESNFSDDPRFYRQDPIAYTNPSQWKFLFYDKFSGSTRRIKYYGKDPTTGQVIPPQVFYQVGTYKAEDLYATDPDARPQS